MTALPIKESDLKKLQKEGKVTRRELPSPVVIEKTPEERVAKAIESVVEQVRLLTEEIAKREEDTDSSESKRIVNILTTLQMTIVENMKVLSVELAGRRNSDFIVEIVNRDDEGYSKTFSIKRVEPNKLTYS